MDYIINNGELYHYGIPGMRWGHKKGPSIASTQKPKRSILFGRVMDESRPKGRHIPGMVVKDEKTNKTSLGKTKKELTPEQKQAKIAKGKKIAAGVLAGVGTLTVAAASAYLIKKYKKRTPSVKSYSKMATLAKPKTNISDDLPSMGKLKRSERGFKRPNKSTDGVGDLFGMVDDMLTTLAGL